MLLSFNVNTGKSECVSHVQNVELKYNIKISDDFVTETGSRLTYFLAYMTDGQNNARNE